MGAAERLEHAPLHPARVQFGKTIVLKTTDIRSRKRHPAHTEGKQVNDIDNHGPEAGAIVACPDSSVSLHSGPSRTCEYKGPFVRTGCQQTIAGGQRHGVPIYIVNFAMISEPALVVMEGVRRVVVHINRGSPHSGLVHVAPDSTHSDIGERFVLLSPPLAHAGIGEIRMDRFARPDMGQNWQAGGMAQKNVLLNAIDVNFVGRVNLHARVNDRYYLHAHR